MFCSAFLVNPQFWIWEPIMLFCALETDYISLPSSDREVVLSGEGQYFLWILICFHSSCISLFLFFIIFLFSVRPDYASLHGGWISNPIDESAPCLVARILGGKGEQRRKISFSLLVAMGNEKYFLVTILTISFFWINLINNIPPKFYLHQQPHKQSPPKFYYH